MSAEDTEDTADPVTSWSVIKNIVNIVFDLSLLAGATGSVISSVFSKGIERPLWLIATLLFLVVSELRDKRSGE